MNTPADNDGAEERAEPTIGFAFQTPFGLFTDAADIPPEMREFIIANVLTSETLTLPVREALAESLGVSLDDAIQSPPTSLASEAHREQLWDLLDQAFPAEPHLWSAAEALFTLSAVNPESVDASRRDAALETATRHLKRYASIQTPAQDPTEQLVRDFREQLDTEI